ncbi:hypothetical protein [Streptomyces cucumeris]|uniref:hypothetical protein n=1 Tax=Streptomyces cucumeris TaxID=2962890 RepID=UPI0020C8AB5D|nr:hypothetical protein [Streptomyces sp. NEAU-Y11]MCP9213246.1 hypothetical protein [Streptomyces sp. NEAU-Y11]
MSHQEIPAERLATLQEIVDASPYSAARQDIQGVSCDDIQAKMDSYFGGAFDDPAAGAGYFIWFLTALINGCGFIWGEQSSMDPATGDPFQLQTVYYYNSDDRGTKVKMYSGDSPELYSNNINTKGDYDSSSDVHNLFRLAPTKARHSDKTMFHMFVQDGAHAGKSVSSYVRSDGLRVVHAVEHDSATADLWVIGDYVHHDEYSGNLFRNFSVNGEPNGWLTIPDGKGGQPMKIDPVSESTSQGHEGRAQVFHFRPASWGG